MKFPLTLAGLALAAALAGPAAAQTPPVQLLKGEVLEVLDVESYTYLRLKTATGEVWAAVTTAKVAKGQQVSIAQPMMMNGFESRILKRRFEQIAFGQLVVPGTAATVPKPGAASVMPGGMLAGMPHGGASSKAAAPAPAAPVAKVAKATGADARTVADVVTGKDKLKDKPVVVRARVVKVNSGIMGKTWIHLQDGSGKAEDGSNDVLVTTQAQAAVGDVVTVRGTVRTDVTVGPGYAYEVMIENATLTR
jgi:hypothetical protein